MVKKRSPFSRFLYRLYDVLTLPFSRDFAYFATIAVLTIFPYLICLLLKIIRGDGAFISDGIPFVKSALDCMIMCYFCAIIFAGLKLFGKIPGAIWKWFTYVACGILTVLDIGCLNALGTPFNSDFVFLMKATNPDESTEFFSFYFTTLTWINIVISMVLIGVALYFINKKWKYYFEDNYLKYKSFAPISGSRIKRLYVRAVPAILLLICFVGYAYQKYLESHGGWAYMELIRRNQIIEAISYESPVLQNPHSDVEVTAVNPENIVLIIGESLSTDHMSLYGYKRETNPELTRLQRDSLLYVFPDIRSSASSTNKSISKMLSTALGDSVEYYEAFTLPDVAKNSGYSTYWLSMQNEKGGADNVVADFAHLCDRYHFLSAAIGSMDSGIYLDEKLIPEMTDIVADTTSNPKLGFIHLMGQHEDFAKRFPPERKPFSESDYTGEYQSDFQRLVVSIYDNSVAYNDSVVAAMMRLFDDREAIVFYTSDHSLDIYQSDPASNYCGHALPGNDLSIDIATKIPFMVYMSPRFQERFPATVQRVRDAVGRPFNTGYLIYTIMDIMGVKFRDSDDVARYSLFRDGDD